MRRSATHSPTWSHSWHREVPNCDQCRHCRARRYCDGTLDRGLEAPRYQGRRREQVDLCSDSALGGSDTEKLVVLELQTAFPAARSVAIRMAPLRSEDRLVTLAYPNQNPRFVSGRFVQYATDGRLAGTALLEMYEGDNRFAVDHGASGAPVFDCEGRIAAVISTVITQILRTPFGVLRISTGMGNAQCRVCAGAKADGIFRSPMTAFARRFRRAGGKPCWARVDGSPFAGLPI